VAGTAGELCVSRAMKETGEVKDFRPAAVVKVILRALRVKWMGIGVGMMTLAFFSLLAVLSIEKVSFVVPVTALRYVAGALGECSSSVNASACVVGRESCWFVSASPWCFWEKDKSRCRTWGQGPRPSISRT